MKKQQKAFTLIELLIVTAILGILASIAYPSYQESVRRTHRFEAQGALESLSASLARWFVENNSSYLGAAEDAGGTTITAAFTGSSSNVPRFFAKTVPVNGQAVTYKIIITDLAKTTYTIKAVPQDQQADDGFLTLSNDSSRSWDENADGSIATTEKSW